SAAVAARSPRRLHRRRAAPRAQRRSGAGDRRAARRLGRRRQDSAGPGRWIERSRRAGGASVAVHAGASSRCGGRCHRRGRGRIQAAITAMLFLLLVTLISLLLAVIMSVIAWRVAGEERRRSDARVAALAADIHDSPRVDPDFDLRRPVDTPIATAGGLFATDRTAHSRPRVATA